MCVDKIMSCESISHAYNCVYRTKGRASASTYPTSSESTTTKFSHTVTTADLSFTAWWNRVFNARVSTCLLDLLEYMYGCFVVKDCWHLCVVNLFRLQNEHPQTLWTECCSQLRGEQFWTGQQIVGDWIAKHALQAKVSGIFMRAVSKILPYHGIFALAICAFILFVRYFFKFVDIWHSSLFFFTEFSAHDRNEGSELR